MAVRKTIVAFFVRWICRVLSALKDWLAILDDRLAIAQKKLEQEMEKNASPFFVRVKRMREESHRKERLGKKVSPVANALHFSLVWLREEVAPMMPLIWREKEVCKTLPDDLVEKIVAMMPFPSIFKARCLSKAWLARFSSISSQDDEEKKGLAISFQRRVREWSGNWESFYPVFTGEKDFLAYDRASRECRGMPSLSFLPDNVMDRSCLECEGALLYGYGQSETGGYELYVTNFLTQTWKRLPPPPTVSLPRFRRKKLVRDETLETYKLILIKPNGRKNYLIDIYHSQSDSWSSKEIVSDFVVQDFPPRIDRVVYNECFDTICPAYLDGVLYIVNSEYPQHFRAVNLEEGTLRELTLSSNDATMMDAIGLAVWNGNVLVIVIAGDFRTLGVLKILQIDIGSLRLIEVACHPTPASYRNAPPVSSGSCIFFNCDSEVLLYNFDGDDWSYFPFPTNIRKDLEYVWLKGACRPGLSPFLEV